jgi:hypothetical protein
MSLLDGLLGGVTRVLRNGVSIASRKAQNFSPGFIAEDDPTNDRINFALAKSTVAETIARTPRLGEMVECIGHSSDTDEGYVTLLGASGAATVDGVDVFASFGDRHWKRVKNRAPVVRSTTIVGDGVADDTAACENSLPKLLKTPGARAELRGARMRLTNTLNLELTTNGEGCVGLGEPAGMTNIHGNYGPTFIWDGVYTDRPMIRWKTSGMLFENVVLQEKAGRSCPVLVNFEMGSLGETRTNAGFRNVTFGGGDTAFAIDWAGVYNANLEDVTMEDVWFFNQREQAVLVNGGQPFGLRFYRHRYMNTLASGLPYGRFMRITSRGTISSIHCADGIWGRGAVGFDCEGDNPPITLSGMHDCEHLKRLINIPNGQSGSGGAINITDGGRFQCAANYNNPGVHPTIAADDHRFMVINGGAQLTVVGTMFNMGHLQEGWKIALGRTAGFTSIRSSYPTSKPHARSSLSSFTPSEPSGRTYLQGNNTPTVDAIAAGGRTSVIIGDTRGCENADYIFEITETDTGKTIFLPSVEMSDDYIVHLTLLSATSGSSAGSKTWEVTSKTKFSIRVELGAAPGAGKTVQYVARFTPKGEAVDTGTVSLLVVPDSTTRMQTTDDGFVLNATGGMFAWLGVQTAIGGGLESHVARYDGNGYALNKTANTIYATVFPGMQTAGYNIDADDWLGKEELVLCNFTGTVAQLWVRRKLVAVSPAGSLVLPAAGTKTLIGGTLAMPSLLTHGFIGANRVGGLTQTQIEGLFDAVRAAGAAVAVPGVTTSHVTNFTTAGANTNTGTGGGGWNLSAGTAPTILKANRVFGWGNLA